MSRIVRTVGLFAVAFCLTGIGLVTTSAWSQTLRIPTYTAAQATRGEELYMDHCDACHGQTFPDGDGDQAPSLMGPAFRNSWSDRGLDETYTFMSTNMPLDNPASLDAATYADILAYLLSESGIPPSTTELPHDVAKLRGMAIPR